MANTEQSLNTKFRKKPVVIDALQWTGSNINEVMGFMNWRNASHDDRNGLIVHTLEGNHHASIGDWIIKGVHGEFYPCKPDIFEKTYESAALAQPSAPVAQQWISVKDRLPSEHDWYAVIVADPDEIGWETRCWWRALFTPASNEQEAHWNSCNPVDDGQPVTHWMPLPAAPSSQKD